MHFLPAQHDKRTKRSQQVFLSFGFTVNIAAIQAVIQWVSHEKFYLSTSTIYTTWLSWGVCLYNNVRCRRRNSRNIVELETRKKMSFNYTTDVEFDYLFKILIIGESGVG